MAIFPALQPSTRTFTPGRYPHSEIPTLSGLQTRVRTSNVLLDQRLRLTFTALTEAEMLSIRTHYLGQQGRFLSFTIPNELLSGTTTPSSFTPTGYSWIYADRPQIQDIGLQRYTVTLELSTVPPEGATLNGAEFTVACTLLAGAGTATSYVAGFDLSVATYILTELVLTVPISFVPGKANSSEYGLITEAVTENLDYALITDTVTVTDDWGPIT
jgi:hypothetical protein